jgi:hypothetical protein
MEKADRALEELAEMRRERDNMADALYFREVYTTMETAIWEKIKMNRDFCKRLASRLEIAPETLDHVGAPFWAVTKELQSLPSTERASILESIGSECLKNCNIEILMIVGSDWIKWLGNRVAYPKILSAGEARSKIPTAIPLIRQHSPLHLRAKYIGCFGASYPDQY